MNFITVPEVAGRMQSTGLFLLNLMNLIFTRNFEDLTLQQFGCCKVALSGLGLVPPSIFKEKISFIVCSSNVSKKIKVHEVFLVI